MFLEPSTVTGFRDFFSGPLAVNTSPVSFVQLQSDSLQYQVFLRSIEVIYLDFAQSGPWRFLVLLFVRTVSYIKHLLDPTRDAILAIAT